MLSCPFNEMQFTKGIPIDCQVRPLVPIVPLVPMDDRNPHVLIIPDVLGTEQKLIMDLFKLLLACLPTGVLACVLACF